MLTKIAIDVDIKTGEVSFSLPDMGLSSKDTTLKTIFWIPSKMS